MCRSPWCEEPSAEGSRFCSTPCELRYEHLKDDARDARLAAAEAAREEHHRREP